MLIQHKRRKEKREWIYVQDGCQVRVVFAPKVQRQARRFARHDNTGGTAFGELPASTAFADDRNI